MSNLDYAVSEESPQSKRRGRPPKAQHAGPAGIVGLSSRETRSGTEHLQRIHHGNFLELAPSLPDQSIDVIIADPPYNASKGGIWSMAHGTLPGFGGDWK